MHNIYYDHAASTPLHPDVLQAMLQHWQQQTGNPSSLHAYGRQARAQINRARDSIANMLGCQPSELIFTSGGTESDNTAIFSAAETMRKLGKRHMITTAIEHHAVLDACKRLEQEGFHVTFLQPNRMGIIAFEQLIEAVTDDTAFISVMYVNNEVGTIQPIEQIGRYAQERSILFHVDAVQALGVLPIELRKLPVDLMSFSAHKINGPQGVGLLYAARNTPFHARQIGGMQERRRRAGTENVAGIIGMAKAVELAVAAQADKQQWAGELRERFISELQAALGTGSIEINGSLEAHVPHIVNVSLPGIDTETMLMNLDLEGIAAASGSACTSGALERSHVLAAMALDEQLLHSAVRFSFGLGNTLEESEYAAKKIATIVERIRTN